MGKERKAFGLMIDKEYGFWLSVCTDYDWDEEGKTLSIDASTIEEPIELTYKEARDMAKFILKVTGKED